MTKIYRNVIWSNRRARLRISPYLAYDRGGLKLPNLKWYYWACQLWTTSFWFRPSSSLSWVTMEGETSSNIPLHKYLYSDKPDRLKNSQITHLFPTPFMFGMKFIYHSSHPFGETTIFIQGPNTRDSNYGQTKVLAK